MNHKMDCLVSAVTVIDNDQDCVENFLKEASQTLSELCSDYEIILVDQNSQDRSRVIVESLLSQINSIRLMGLSKRIDKDIALAAGLENAIGDFVILIDIRHDPVNIIPQAVQQCFKGNDIIIGVAKNPQTLCYRIIRPCINWILKRLLNYTLPQNATEFRCLSRRATNAVTRTGRFRHSLFIKISQTGYSSSSIKYITKSSSIKRSISEGVPKAMRMLIYNSSKPLRWISILGCAGSFMASVFALYSLIIHFVKNQVAEGWTTLVLFMSSLFFMLFIVLSIFGEYLGRLLDGIHSPYEYDILFEKHSSVMQETNRYNVLDKSICDALNAVQTGRNK